MKHTFLSSAVLFVMCIGTLSAQDSLRVKSFVSRKFETEFAGATNIEWSKARQTFIALFKYNDDIWLAFYNEHGELLASGRRLGSVHQLPLRVQLSVADNRRRIERKYGRVVTSFALELMAYGTTRYYVPMQNQYASVMMCADQNGDVKVSTRKSKIGNPIVSPELLAQIY